MASRPSTPLPASPSRPATPPPSSPGMVVDRDDLSTVPWPWRLYAGVTAHLGLPIIALWIAVTVAATAFLPDFGSDSGFGLVQLVPSNTAASRAQTTEQRLFGSSLADSPALIVEHGSSTLPASTLVKIGQQARAVDSSHPTSASPRRPDFALPLVNV